MGAMKKILVFFLILLPLIHLQGQALYEHYIATKTHDTVISTSWEILDRTEVFLLSFRMLKHNSQYFLELRYHFGEGPAFRVNKGDSLRVKFLSGWGFSVFAKDNVQSQVGMAAFPQSPWGVVTQGVYVQYPLTVGQMAAFKNEKVEKLWICTSRGFDTYVFKKDYRSEFGIACINLSAPFYEWKLVEYPKWMKNQN